MTPPYELCRDAVVFRNDLPRVLRHTGDAPSFLEVAGRLRETSRSVAIVGARAARYESMKRARCIAQGLSRCGIGVISGGALGIDSASHRGALDESGYTVAVLGSGLREPYPERNVPLFLEIASRGGAVVSPFESSQPPKRWHFVARNRIIAGLADLVLVVEASARSGSLHTARAARRYGRFVAACSGSRGTEALLAQGVPEARSAEDIVAILDGCAKRPRLDLSGFEVQEMQILKALREVSSVEGLALGLEMSPRQVRRSLMKLELEGVVVQQASGYQLSPLAQAALSGHSAT